MRDGWVETTLGEVSESSWGNTEITKSKYVPTGFLAFSASGADGFLDWFEHDTSAVILSAIGAQCGKTWFASGKWTAIKNTIWIKSNGVSLYDKYLFYLSNIEHFWQIRGQAQPFISLGDVKKKKLILPPLAEQKRIVDLISSVDSYIEALQQQVDKTRKSRIAVLHELLTKGGDDSKELTLGQLLTLEYGKPLTEKNRDGTGFPVFASAGIVGFHKEPLVSEFPVIIVGRKGTAGAVYWSETPCYVIDTAYYVKPISDIDLRFLYLLLAFIDLKSVTAQTGVPGLNRDRAYSLKCNVPKKSIQLKVVSLMRQFDDFIESAEITINKTQLLRSGLLSDLLSGNHEIPITYDKLIGAA